MLLSRIDILEEIKGMYKVLCKDGRAKRARLETVHGTVETPVFMNVGTIGAIKGAVSTRDLEELFIRNRREMITAGKPGQTVFIRMEAPVKNGMTRYSVIR